MFKKLNDSYTLIVVSGARSKNREFVFSSKFIKSSLIFLLIFFSVFSYIVVDYLGTTFNKSKMITLELETKEKSKKIDTLVAQIDKLNKNVLEMEDFKKKILVVTGLNSYSALKEVGSGGPDFNAINGTRDLSLDLKKDILNQTTNINNKAQETIGAMKLAYDTIGEQKEKWSSIPSVWPTRGYISDGFRMRTHPMTGKREFHPAIDIATQLGNPIISPANGVIIAVEEKKYMGKMLVIDHGFGYTTRYGHLGEIYVKEGDLVVRGDTIASVGMTGRTNGPHLHYEIKYNDEPVNPEELIMD